MRALRAREVITKIKTQNAHCGTALDCRGLAIAGLG